MSTSISSSVVPSRTTPRLTADRSAVAVGGFTAVGFAWLFAEPARLLLRDWWSNAEAGHGLILGPLALWLAYRTGLIARSSPSRALGGAMLALAVIMRYAAALAAELFTMRLSMLLAIAGLIVFYAGMRQLIAWWLPFALLLLAIPLPSLVLSALALPLQLQASQFGASLLELRSVPVVLAGNVIRLPGQDLFVTEACSGLRSLTALLSIGVLLSGLALERVPARLMLLAVTIPIAIFVNAVRVFLTGYTVYFLGPPAGEGVLHLTEGWLLFVVSMVLIGIVVKALALIERHLSRRGSHG